VPHPVFPTGGYLLIRFHNGEVCFGVVNFGDPVLEIRISKGWYKKDTYRYIKREIYEVKNGS
jgi:hypothetical protein